MGFRLTIQGIESQGTYTFGEKIMSFVNVGIDTPRNSMGKSSDVDITLHVAGHLISPDDISSDSDTIELMRWAQVPAQSADSYRSVTVETIAAGQTIRKMDLSHAFVIRYNETYTESKGVGSFSMVIRQRVDQISKVKAQGPQQQSADQSAG